MLIRQVARLGDTRSGAGRGGHAGSRPHCRKQVTRDFSPLWASFQRPLTGSRPMWRVLPTVDWPM